MILSMLTPVVRFLSRFTPRVRDGVDQSPRQAFITIALRIMFELIRLFLGIVFLASAIGKFLHPYEFLGIVYDYRLIHPDIAFVVGITTPWFELIIGVFLLSNLFMGGAFLLSIGLLASFVGALVSVLLRGIVVECGCFSLTSDSDPVTGVTVLRTGVLLGLAVSGYLLYLLLHSCSRASQ